MSAYDYEGFFAAKIDTLRSEGNYRYFADIERKRGAFPHAQNHHKGRGADRPCCHLIKD